MDRVQERVLREQDAVAARIEAARAAGLEECEDCGAPISALRRGLGARLCIEHQTVVEARSRR